MNLLLVILTTYISTVLRSYTTLLYIRSITLRQVRKYRKPKTPTCFAQADLFFSPTLLHCTTCAQLCLSWRALNWFELLHLWHNLMREIDSCNWISQESYWESILWCNSNLKDLRYISGLKVERLQLRSHSILPAFVGKNTQTELPLMHYGKQKNGLKWPMISYPAWPAAKTVVSTTAFVEDSTLLLTKLVNDG